MDEAAILATCQEIHAYAEAHYEDSGWSVITECYTPKDMVKEMSYWGNPLPALRMSGNRGRSRFPSGANAWQTQSTAPFSRIGRASARPTGAPRR